jgi:hypothetical protein
MDKTLSILLEMFKDFFKRAVFPSIFLLGTVYILEIIDKNIQLLPTIKSENYIYIFVIIIISSFIMSILTQGIFDNNLKRNFKTKIFFTYENELLDSLRDKCSEKLKHENEIFDNMEHTDALLYQIIGRKLAFIQPPTKTKRYVDEVKSAGIVFLSLLISLFIYLIYNFSLILLLCFLLISALLLLLAFDYIKSKYRSRAIRIYVNYLIGKNY